LAEYDYEINRRIIKIRKIMGYTQKKFAEPLKLSCSFQGGIESNHRKVNERLIKMISLTYGVSETWLKTGKGEMHDLGKDPRLERIIMNFNKLPPQWQDYVMKHLDWLMGTYINKIMETKPPEIHGILAKNVKEQRKKLGLTLEKLAELSGLAVQTINDIEGGRRWVSDNTITKLSKALRIESYQLLIADFFSQTRKKDTPTQHFISLKEKILKNVDLQIETQFNDFLKSGLVQPVAGYDKTLEK